MRFERSLREILGAKEAAAHLKATRTIAGSQAAATRQAKALEIPPIGGGGLSRPERLLIQAATGAHKLDGTELQEVLEHVAKAGFDPTPNVSASGFSGMVWQGKTLKGSDRITSEARHYLRHVEQRKEWPTETLPTDYVSSIREVILDPTSGVFASRLDNQWQLGVIRRSESFRGPRGSDWVMVEYRLGIGRWVTAFQPRSLSQTLGDARRTNMRWIRSLTENT